MTAAAGALRAATRELHHAAERHRVGAAMADGTIRPDWWADWIGALLVIHRRIDPWMPHVLQRTTALEADLWGLADAPRRNEPAEAFVHSLRTTAALDGAGYVFTGAHLMGGAVTDRALAGRLPTAHLRWDDRPAALAAWRPWRDATHCEAEARAAFAAVIAIMDAIVEARP